MTGGTHRPWPVRLGATGSGAAIWVRRLHGLLGLSAGLLLAVIGLSGSLLVAAQTGAAGGEPGPRFRSESRVSLDRLFAAVQQANPRRYGPWLLELPLGDSRELVAWYERPEESEDRDYAPLVVTVDLDSGRILDTGMWGESGLGWWSELHGRLRLERGGATVMAGLAAATVLLVGLGLGIWLQQRRLAPPADGSPRSDWLRYGHAGLGLAAAPALLVTALTAAGMTLAPPWTQRAAPDEAHSPSGPLRSTAEPNSQPLGIEAALAVASGLFARAQPRRILLPAGEIGTYRVDFCQRLESDCRHPATAVWIDRYSGQVRAVNNPSQWNWRQRLAHSLRSYHSAAALGWGGRLYWFAAGIIPLLLLASGLVRWSLRRGWLEDSPLALAPARTAVAAAAAGIFSRISTAVRSAPGTAESLLARLRARLDTLQRRYFR